MSASRLGWAERCELAGLFFIQAMALGMWIVPLGPVLSAHGYGELRPWAFATSAIATFISPLIFGAMADRHAAPVVVLRWLAVASAITLALAAKSITSDWPTMTVLALIQLYSICAAPSSSLSVTIVLSRLHDSQRQFGPIRSLATFGWMCGCWLVSGLRADSSPVAAYAAAGAWLGLAGLTFWLPAVPPPAASGRATLRERMGWDALSLLKHHDHRVVLITTALASIPLAAFYPFTPSHLASLGFQRTTAWMSLGQVTEIISMFLLGALFARFRLKWILGTGLCFGVLRFALCAFNQPAALLAGVSLHGFSFALFFVTAQIYLNERVETAWRARAQALLSLMNAGVGNLVGYLGTGFWLKTCTQADAVRWTRFWAGLSIAMAVVLIYFLIAYHGKGGGLRKQS